MLPRSLACRFDRSGIIRLLTCFQELTQSLYKYNDSCTTSLSIVILSMFSFGHPCGSGRKSLQSYNHFFKQPNFSAIFFDFVFAAVASAVASGGGPWVVPESECKVRPFFVTHQTFRQENLLPGELTCVKHGLFSLSEKFLRANKYFRIFSAEVRLWALRWPKGCI